MVCGEMLSYSWRYYQERRVLRHATLAVCNSGYTADAIRDAYQIDRSRLRVIRKAVDTESFRRPKQPVPDPLVGRSRGARLVFVGSDWRRKGLDVLLAALDLVARQIPHVSLCALGPDPQDTELQRLLTRPGIVGRVHLTGQASKDMVARHLWHSDVFVLPSRREALGVAALEAMAAGLPVVAAAVGGIPEMVRSGREGVLVPPDHPNELAAALVRLLMDSDTRVRMAAAAKHRAEEFSVRVMTQSLRKTYLQLAAGGST